MTNQALPTIGALSGQQLNIPHVNVDVLTGGAVVNGVHDERFTPSPPPEFGFPDNRNYRRRFGLVIPATNTTMENELWSLILSNAEAAGLDGVGLRTTPVITPKPDISTAEGIAEFKAGFIDGLESAVQTALLARPQYMIMGLSLEHILLGLDSIRETMEKVQVRSGLSWATWHDAVKAALGKLVATRIAILTPFGAEGNASAIQMFNDMGIDVVASVGLTGTDLSHLAHIPDAAKERAITEILAIPSNEIHAVVQCGTGMSMLNIIDGLEARTGVPIVAINPTVLWYALRENGFSQPLLGAGRLLREF